MKAFNPREWNLSKDQKAKLLRANAKGIISNDNSLAFRRLIDMGFIEYQEEDAQVHVTDRGRSILAQLR